MFKIPGLTNSGSMPINAGGGAGGPSRSVNDTQSSFRVGDINMGGRSVPGWLWGVLILLAFCVYKGWL